jgi:hypothetical protein
MSSEQELTIEIALFNEIVVSDCDATVGANSGQGKVFQHFATDGSRTNNEYLSVCKQVTILLSNHNSLAIKAIAAGCKLSRLISLFWRRDHLDRINEHLNSRENVSSGHFYRER